MEQNPFTIIASGVLGKPQLVALNFNLNLEVWAIPHEGTFLLFTHESCTEEHYVETVQTHVQAITAATKWFREMEAAAQGVDVSQT